MSKSNTKQVESNVEQKCWVLENALTEHVIAPARELAFPDTPAEDVLTVFLGNDELRPFFVYEPHAGVAKGATFPGDEFPEFIQRRLAVLNMVDVSTIIDGVGRKTSDDTFYIILTEDADKQYLRELIAREEG